MPPLTKGQPQDWLPKRLGPGDVVIDVGANVGHVSELLAKVVGATNVHAVEPDSRCWEPLERLGVVVHKVAAAQYAGTGTLTVSRESPQTSLHARNVNNMETTIAVPLRPLDDLVSGPVAAVKIDTQGSELDALKGATALLQRCPLWVVEVWPFGLPNRRDDLVEMLDLMERYGKHPYTLTEPPLAVTREELLTWCGEAQDHRFINLAWM